MYRLKNTLIVKTTKLIIRSSNCSLFYRKIHSDNWWISWATWYSIGKFLNRLLREQFVGNIRLFLAGGGTKSVWDSLLRTGNSPPAGCKQTGDRSPTADTGDWNRQKNAPLNSRVQTMPQWQWNIIVNVPRRPQGRPRWCARANEMKRRASRPGPARASFTDCN